MITVTDAYTSKPHIVTRMTSVGAFLKMIKTRFGETLPIMENMLKVSPFETGQRHLRTVSDFATYRKLHQTLPAAVLSALKARIKNGEPEAIKQLWEKKDKTFLAIDFEWSERNSASCLEWGYATVRCGHLNTYVKTLQTDNLCTDSFSVSEYGLQFLRLTIGRAIALFSVRI